MKFLFVINQIIFYLNILILFLIGSYLGKKEKEKLIEENKNEKL